MTSLLPHGYCLSWQPDLLAMFVIGNLLIAVSYFAIPFIILKFVRLRKDIDFRSMHWLFAGFITTCGITHLLHVVELWYPVYYLEAVMDLLTAAISIVSAVILWKLLPVVVALPSTNQLLAANDEQEKLTTALRESETQLRSLGDSLPDSFLYQYTLQGDKAKFLYLSSGIERINGITVDCAMQDAMALLGQIEPTQLAPYAQAQADSQQFMADFSMDLHMLRPDGEWRWLQVRSRPRKNTDGHVIWDGIATDITDRHLLETEINRLAQAVEQSPTGIVITDTAGTLEFMNAACTRIVGYQFAEAYNKIRSPREIISPEISDTEYALVQSHLLSGKSWSGVLRNRHKNGKQFWSHTTATPIFNNEGAIASYLYLMSDVTDQKNAEAALEVRSSALERANADLTRFADVSAHHLMEPTRRLTIYTQQVRMRLAEFPELKQDEELRASLDYIERDAARLRIMVRDVQLYLAAASPRGDVNLLNANDILESLKYRMASQLNAQHVTLNINPLPDVVLDRPRLMDLFTLLLDNALRHGQPPDAKVHQVISISGEREAHLSRFRICDNGSGIPVEYLERVFEIFERLNVANREDGTGIGLAIARRIVESRHGKIWIENLPEGGAMAVFELPDDN
ncbi:MAG: PAS domain S-box protein [Gallionellaceae bacterium]|jgi:PAS domain S-box-containing protein